MLTKNIMNIFIVLLYLSSGILGYSITDCLFSKTSNCSPGGGLISGKDAFTVTVRLDNSSGGGPQLATFSIRGKDEVSFGPACNINLHSCSNVPELNCDCVNNVDVYTAYFQMIATVVPYDRAEIRLSWGNGSCSTLVETIEDLSTTTCDPKVVSGNANPSDCQFEFQKTVEYCCDETSLSPIETTITFFDGVSYTSYDSRCVSVIESNAREGTYTFTRTVCGIPTHSSSCYGTPVEASGQDISCSISKTSTCNKGLVPLVDYFTVSCTLDKSVAVTNKTRFLVSQGASFRTECWVFLSLCAPDRNPHCNCVDNGSTYTAYFNVTAVFEYSKREIRLALENSAIYGSVFTDIVQEPEEAVCTLNGETIPDGYSGKCPFSIAKGTGTRVIYTCNSALLPVMTYISFNNTDYEGSASVVIDPSESGVGEYMFSSTICGIAAHSGFCNATLGSKPEPACDDTCLISIVVVVVVVVIGGTIVVLIVFWKKRLVCWDKAKRSSTNGTEGSRSTSTTTM